VIRSREKPGRGGLASEKIGRGNDFVNGDLTGAVGSMQRKTPRRHSQRSDPSGGKRRPWGSNNQNRGGFSDFQCNWEASGTNSGHAKAAREHRPQIELTRRDFSRFCAAETGEGRQQCGAAERTLQSRLILREVVGEVEELGERRDEVQK